LITEVGAKVGSGFIEFTSIPTHFRRQLHRSGLPRPAYAPAVNGNDVAAFENGSAPHRWRVFLLVQIQSVPSVVLTSTHRNKKTSASAIPLFVFDMFVFRRYSWHA
jgi:hypothetical protein